MHAAEYSSNLLQINFTATQTQNVTNELRISVMIQDRIACGKYFYGIEVSANSRRALNFGGFLHLPMFTSIVWLGECFSAIEPIGKVPAIECALALRPYMVPLPHFTCFNATRRRLTEMLDYDFRNVLALRGDQVNEAQEFKYASELVSEIRRIRCDNVSIGVGGYPDSHPSSKSMEEDLTYLKKKVDAGADFVVTQLTFSKDKLIAFIKNCRAHGITVPIIPGIFAPESFQSLQRMSQLSQVVCPSDQLEQYRRYEHNPNEFRKFSRDRALELVEEIFDSDLNIHGVHFFTLNKFEVVTDIVNRLAEKYRF